MRKGTKGIRKVSTGINEYYVYDLDEDAFGKRKRLYAKSESELKEKIEKAMEERQISNMTYKPKTTLLADYVRFYFKNAVGSIPSRDIKRLINLFERAVFGSEIDKDITELKAEDVQEFYSALLEKFPVESVKDIDTVLNKTFEISNEEGITNIKLENMDIPDSNTQVATTSYILTPDEFDNMLSFCIADNCTRYGKNELVVIFSMLTGLKFSAIKTLKAGDIDLENGIMVVKFIQYKLSDECVSWLKQQAIDGTIPLPYSSDSDTKSENTEGIGIARYTYDKNKVVFTNSHGTSPTLQSIQSTVFSITKRCGLPRGITGKTICKSFVISELEKGKTIEQLCEYFKYKNRRLITDVQDEYEVRKALF